MFGEPSLDRDSKETAPFGRAKEIDASHHNSQVNYRLYFFLQSYR
jgi:hypothetical protein